MSSYRLLIGGRLVEGKRSLDVRNPATLEMLASASCADQGQLQEALASAKAAFRSWESLGIDERANGLACLAGAMQARAEELARLLTQEQGKPLAEAMMEVQIACAILGYYAQMRPAPVVIEDNSERLVEAFRFQLGVVALITAWNFPLMLLAFKLAPALLAGNTVVCKPAPTTPLTTLKVAELCAEIFPPGVVNVVVDRNDLGDQLTSHPDIAKISFTGSTATGKKVMASAALGLKRLTLELGGNDAAIVLQDVDPRSVAGHILQGAFTNCGQVCFAIKRLYVHDAIYDAMCEELVSLARQAIVGNGLDPGTTMGPLQNRLQYKKAISYFDDAGEHGRVLCGGVEAGPSGYFVKPAIVADIKEGCRLVDEEQFCPILPVLRFSSVDEAVERANATVYGLGGSVWTPDVAKGREIAARLEAGTVLVNQYISALPHIPVGGIKQSGIGVELGLEGLEEFTRRAIVHSPR